MFGRTRDGAYSESPTPGFFTVMVLLDLRQAHWGPSPKRPYPLAAGFRSNLGLVPPPGLPRAGREETRGRLKNHNWQQLKYLPIPREAQRVLQSGRKLSLELYQQCPPCGSNSRSRGPCVPFSSGVRGLATTGLASRWARRSVNTPKLGFSWKT